MAGKVLIHSTSHDAEIRNEPVFGVGVDFDYTTAISVYWVGLAIRQGIMFVASLGCRGSHC